MKLYCIEFDNCGYVLKTKLSRAMMTTCPDCGSLLLEYDDLDEPEYLKERCGSRRPLQEGFYNEDTKAL